MLSSTYDILRDIRTRRGAGFIVLIDPDKLDSARVPAFVRYCEAAGVDALFVGGSLLHAVAFDDYVQRLKASTRLPVIGFPGSLAQVSGALDAILYLSVISSRNPEYLFGQHVHAAPMLQRLNLEPISTGYMLIESGRGTTAQYMTHSTPLPRHKPEIAAATALAAEMMGMRLLFADGGSGAEHPVPIEIVAAIRSVCERPLLVGGGLRNPEAIEQRVRAGADFVVVGNAIEEKNDPVYIAELAAAAHVGVPQPLEG